MNASVRWAGYPCASASITCSIKVRLFLRSAFGLPTKCVSNGARSRQPEWLGIGNVRGIPCMIIANDATVKAGAFFHRRPKRSFDSTNRIRMLASLVYLVDSAGVFLPMQDEIFPDEDDFGRIFRNNSMISAAGIPRLRRSWATVSPGAYLPVLCDKILMTKGRGYISQALRWSKQPLVKSSMRKSSAARKCTRR